MSLLGLIVPESLSGAGQPFYDGDAQLPDTVRWEAYSRDVELEPLGRVIAGAIERYDDERQASDAWLAPRVHATLRLTPRDAADSRIWRYAAHVAFPDYVRWRWKAEGKSVAPPRFRGPDMSQALSRLWWGAELARNGSSYEHVGAAFEFQDIPNTWFRLHVFHHRPAVLAALRVIGELKGGYLPGDRVYAKRTDKINRLSTAVNLLAVTTALDVLVPYAGPDISVLESWITEEPEPERYLDELPLGPPEPAVDAADVAVAEKFIQDAADAAGLFHDDSEEQE